MELTQKLEHYFDRLWPICRSITGDGLRESLQILSEVIPLTTHEVASGTQVFDWVIPNEWNIRDAWIETPGGRRICQFKDNNLHVLNYSIPVDALMTLEELKPHLHTLRSQPDAIPYVTSYFKEKWGFCISRNELNTLPDEGEYRVFIDSTLAPGSLTYGECILPGKSGREILISTYLCHPSLANNELSGPLAAAFLCRKIMDEMPDRIFTYRFIWIPETIGAITYLSRHGNHLKEYLEGGFVMTCCGDPGELTYKFSKRGDTAADRAAIHTLNSLKPGEYRTTPFAVGGSDERQYCSPGFNLPVGSIMRTPYQRFKEYHTSLDNKSFISFPHLADTIDTSWNVLRAMELNQHYQTTIPYCEPQLGKRGMYPDSVNPEDARDHVHRLLHFLTYADGATDLIQMAELRNEPVFLYEEIIRKCRMAGLIE